jgi:plasmid stability protein
VSRDTLEYVAQPQRKNVTLSLPEDLLRRLRVYAASSNQSMSSVMAEAIRRMMDPEGENAKAKLRFLERMQRADDRGTHGVISWTRDELHERCHGGACARRS